MKWISHEEWSGEKQVEVKVEYFTFFHLDAYFEVKVWSRTHFYSRKWKYLELK